MPSDIRSFFGGKPPASQESVPETKTKAAPKRGRAARKVVEDSDEEEAAPKSKKSTPVKPAKRAPSPDGEATTTSDYFGKSKPKRSEPVRAAPEKKANGTSEVKTPVKSKSKSKDKPANGITYDTPTKPASKSTPRSRGSAKSKHPKAEVDDFDENDFPDALSDDEPTMAKAASAKKATSSTRNGTAKSTPTSTRSKPVKKEEPDYEEDNDVKMEDAEDDDDFVVPDDDELPKKGAKGKKATGTKRKAKDLDDDDLDDETPKKKGRASGSAAKKKKEDPTDSAEITAILNDIPTIRAPTPPPPEEGGGYKFKFGANKNVEAAGGPMDFPTGEPNCLAGLTFVFTGQLKIARDDGVRLVKEYGGKVQGQASKTTRFVVLGEEAGPKKLKTIKDYNLPTIDEEGLFYLVRTLPANGGDSKAGAKAAEKLEKDEQKIRKAAAEMEAEEKKQIEKAKAVQAAGGKVKDMPVDGKDHRLWTVKHAPSQLNHIVGNKGVVEKLQRWLRNYPKNAHKEFKLAGPDGSGTFRAVILSGPPGIGKTTAAHLVAKLEGFDIVESNASDTRSKKLVETGLKGITDSTSLNGFFAGDGKTVQGSKRKLCLIMDEVDGMSAGDRGGVGAMAAVIKKSTVPIILICNERRLPKMKPFDHVAYDLTFKRPTTDMIKSRMKSIVFREKLNMPDNVLTAIIEGTHADLRQIVNMLSTAKVDDTNMSFDESKDMSKAWAKHVVLKPWDINSKILGGSMFGTSSNKTLNDKSELYFNDHELSYLMLQENYLGTRPSLASSMPNEKLSRLKTIQLASDAAESISDGDLVDRMIHGSQQQWSLMPAHAIFSFVRPASYMYGNMGYGSRSGFPQWLGKNSAQGKLTRFVKEIQGHMRLRMTGDRHDVRQQYIPLLWKELIDRLQKEGKEAVDEIIEMMDSYYLTKDDFDAIMELGVGPFNQEKVKIESQDKAAFTREYNKRDHPLPFMKASSVAVPKKLTKDKPDLEEAIEESDDDEVVNIKDEDDEEDMDLSKDKYVKMPKKKKAPVAAKGKGAKKVKNEEDDEEEEEKPKKGKGKAAAKGKGKK